MKEKKFIEWLAVLQGFSMLLVVMGHAAISNIERDPRWWFAAKVEEVIYTFHMPLFMFISGYLFYYTCLGPGKAFSRIASSKLKRLGRPFLLFTVVTIGMKMAAAPLMKHPFDLHQLVDVFVLFRSNPLGEMWFINTLIMIMVGLYPVLRYFVKGGTPAVLILLGSIAVYYLFPNEFSYYRLNTTALMLPIFLCGILACKYNVVERWMSKWVLIGSLVMFTLCNVVGVLPHSWELMSKLTGICASVAVCHFLSQRFPNLFSSFRDYTFQIFLLAIFFQMAIRWVYRLLPQDSTLIYAAMYVVSVCTGIFVPVAIAKAIKRYFPKPLHSWFGL